MWRRAEMRGWKAGRAQGTQAATVTPASGRPAAQGLSWRCEQGIFRGGVTAPCRSSVKLQLLDFSLAPLAEAVLVFW